jgi:hypothetical protein
MHVESVNAAGEIDEAEEAVKRMRADTASAMEIISDTINSRAHTNHASFSRGLLLGRCVKLREKLVELGIAQQSA